ncbi:hypothetical protein BDZ45DRAFT_729147 [Acephala macrosclerotiorum]|nr:hypothetical protein BDZ45DRAFT_729147 [Acephala macrosclerotiorum]
MQFKSILTISFTIATILHTSLATAAGAEVTAEKTAARNGTVDLLARSSIRVRPLTMLQISVAIMELQLLSAMPIVAPLAPIKDGLALRLRIAIESHGWIDGRDYDEDGEVGLSWGL